MQESNLAWLQDIDSWMNPDTRKEYLDLMEAAEGQQKARRRARRKANGKTKRKARRRARRKARRRARRMAKE